YSHPLDLPSFPTRRSSDLHSVSPSLSNGGSFQRGSFLSTWYSGSSQGMSAYASQCFSTDALFRRSMTARYDFLSLTCSLTSSARSEEHTSELQSRENLVCR